MHTVATVLLLTFVAILTKALSFEKRVSPVPVQANSYYAVPFAKSSPDRPSNNYLKLDKVYNDGKHGIDKCPNGFSPAIQEVRPYSGVSYLTDIKINNETHTVVLDTGSSDTWLFKSDFECRDQWGFSQAQWICHAGPGYTGSFPPNNPLKNVSLDIRYGDNTFARGQFGFANVTIAGLTAVNTQIALANESYWRGDDISAGLLGLGYPALTAAYIDGNYSQRLQYDPVFTTLWKQGSTAPLFSVILRRDGPGYLAFGGLPPGNYSNIWGKTPIVVSYISSRQAFDYGFYSIVPDRFVYNGSDATNSDIYFLDTGSTLTYLPGEIAERFNANFDPPPDVIDGRYYVDCDQAAPDFAIQIGGVRLRMNRRDVISRVGTRCMSGIQNAYELGMVGGEGQPKGLLGDSFLNGVVAVHDVGAAQMRFAEHAY